LFSSSIDEVQYFAIGRHAASFSEQNTVRSK
jgi:hypothetical protein